MAVYEVMCRSRTPASGAHTRADVASVAARGLTMAEELDRGWTVSFRTNVADLPSSVKARLGSLGDDTPVLQPVEFQVLRDNVVYFEGPVLTFDLDSDSGDMAIRCGGLEAYFGYMRLQADYAPSAVDQFTIAAALVNQWQVLSWGNYGIDLSTIGTSGTVQTRDWKTAQNLHVDRLLLEFADRADGFNFWVEPGTRRLKAATPRRGSDLTASVVLDHRTILSATIQVSVAPGDIASNAYMTSGVGTDTVLTGTFASTTARDAWGLSAVSESALSETPQASLDEMAEELQRPRSKGLFVPSVQIIPTAGYPVTAYNVGDTVTYSFDAGLGLSTLARRIRRKQVSVDDDSGEEVIDLDFD